MSFLHPDAGAASGFCADGAERRESLHIYSPIDADASAFAPTCLAASTARQVSASGLLPHNQRQQELVCPARLLAWLQGRRLISVEEVWDTVAVAVWRIRRVSARFLLVRD